MTSLNSTDEPPLKRQRVAKSKALLKDLPADEFQKKAAMYSGPFVTITVREKEFVLSKPLLQYYTSFFDEDLKAPGQEGEGRELVFDGCSPETFQLVHQWIYNSHINIPTLRQNKVQDGPINCIRNGSHGSADLKNEASFVPESDTKTGSSVTTMSIFGPKVPADTPASSRQSSVIPTEKDTAFTKWAHEEDIHIEHLQGIETNPKAQAISRILAFLKLANTIGLLGPFDSVVVEIRSIILSFGGALLAGHIRAASELPSGHSVRILFAEACLRAFAKDMFPRPEGAKPSVAFKFDKELDELDSFAADLIRVYKNVSKKKAQVLGKKEGVVDFLCADPLTSGTFRLPGI
ncbi:uncharacterized protein RCO7_06045 [Rhynchosporium graminicola]|uniref:BTB domain-containing protein n=1 Tax=Rhynchosporium graminicola TaxID=2792576 RepID=A0A1E1KXM3_9HELO|nr:uncharacterized protein RCO7_06045 [Rhynchosporium commune]